MIGGAFCGPTWAFCSRLVSPVASGGLWFVPRGIPRRVSSVDDFEAFVLREVGVVLDVERGERRPADEATGGDPRVVRRPRTAAQLGVGLDLSPTRRDVLVVGRTTSAARKVRIVSTLRGPQWRTRVHLVSSP